MSQPYKLSLQSKILNFLAKVFLPKVSTGDWSTGVYTSDDEFYSLNWERAKKINTHHYHPENLRHHKVTARNVEVNTARRAMLVDSMKMSVVVSLLGGAILYITATGMTAVHNKYESYRAQAEQMANKELAEKQANQITTSGKTVMYNGKPVTMQDVTEGMNQLNALAASGKIGQEKYDGEKKVLMDLKSQLESVN